MTFFEEYGFEKNSPEMKILNRVTKLVVENAGGMTPTTNLIKTIIKQELETVMEVYGEYMHNREFRDMYQEYIFDKLA